eukprot:CAMPEP_0117692240 /NCGR_PEP_ID=MMETSP0804-20121206/26212_1 /TAXON_ID=1074897 /ORGANISM="Tetraselmis astigmatica, Strain CCMP880" /LENGTH=101 /DNA_ID=CAMNT_0005505655 /DNA_START=230 /DNA_END=535 /DNA_ORIENTATION=+
MALMNFKVFFMAFVNFATSGSKILRGTPLEFMRPGLKNTALNLEAWFGSAAAWKPNTTHILLMGIMITLLFGLERVRSEIARGNAAKRGQSLHGAKGTQLE